MATDFCFKIMKFCSVLVVGATQIPESRWMAVCSVSISTQEGDQAWTLYPLHLKRSTDNNQQINQSSPAARAESTLLPARVARGRPGRLGLARVLAQPAATIPQSTQRTLPRMQKPRRLTSR